MIGNLHRGLHQRRHDVTIVHLPVEDVGFVFDEDHGTVWRDVPRHWVVVMRVDGEELCGLDVGGLSGPPGAGGEVGNHPSAVIDVADEVYLPLGVDHESLRLIL